VWASVRRIGVKLNSPLQYYHGSKTRFHWRLCIVWYPSTCRGLMPFNVGYTDLPLEGNRIARTGQEPAVSLLLFGLLHLVMHTLNWMLMELSLKLPTIFDDAA
jgi:hypothetical protein